MPFLDEIADRLVAQGVGTRGANIKLGSNADIPNDGDDPILSLIETGGSGPTRVQNKASANTQRPTAQVCVRGKSYKTARAMAKAAYDALDGIFNVTLGTTFYQSVTARQEPHDLGLDSTGRRVMIVFNIDAEKNPS